MPQASHTSEGDVALVVRGGEGLGREVALALACEGVKVVVGGPDEKAVARVVGEITCGAGVARHVAGDLSRPADLQAILRKGVEAFGKLTLVVLLSPDMAEIARVLDTALVTLADGGRFVVVSAPSADLTALLVRVGAGGRGLQLVVTAPEALAGIEDGNADAVRTLLAR